MPSHRPLMTRHNQIMGRVDVAIASTLGKLPDTKASIIEKLKVTVRGTVILEKKSVKLRLRKDSSLLLVRRVMVLE